MAKRSSKRPNSSGVKTLQWPAEQENQMISNKLTLSAQCA